MNKCGFHNGQLADLPLTAHAEYYLLSDWLCSVNSSKGNKHSLLIYKGKYSIPDIVEELCVELENKK